MTACGKEDTTSNIPDNSELALNTTSSEVTKDVNSSEEMDSESEMKQDNIEFGLTINDTYYPIPITLKQFVDEGWSISDKTPYFLNPMVGEDYYEMRTNWSLSKNGEGILPGGSIIRLLEKTVYFWKSQLQTKQLPKKPSHIKKLKMELLILSPFFMMKRIPVLS